MAMIFDEMGEQEAFTALVMQDLEAEFGARELLTVFQPIVESYEWEPPPISTAVRECDTRSMTLEAIGKEMGVGRERIRQIEGKALRKLRNPGVTRLLGEPREPPYVHFVDSDAELVHSREADAPRRFGYWRRVALLIWKYCGMYQWQYANAQGVSLAASPLIYYTEASAISNGLLGRHGGQ